MECYGVSLSILNPPHWFVLFPTSLVAHKGNFYIPLNVSLLCGIKQLFWEFRCYHVHKPCLKFLDKSFMFFKALCLSAEIQMTLCCFV